jgi:glycosyltransferase involved in cell wall biosynthesis
MRLAFLTPLPPAPTGIADYSADVIGLLASRHEIDVFHDQEEVERDRLPRALGIHRAAEFPRRHAERPYDLAVYQMGNGVAHAFLYPLLVRVPGLLVLHDLVLHHSRAKTFLESPEALAYARDPSSADLRERARTRIAEYEAEVAYVYPAQSDRLALTHLSTTGDLLPYAYPLFRIPVEASRLTAVHNDFMAAAIREEVPGAGVACVALPVAPSPREPVVVANLRRRLGFEPTDLVVGCFGLMTREKRVPTVARAVRRAAVAFPRLRLLLVGPLPDAPDLRARLESLGMAERTVVAGRVPRDDLATYMEAADIVVHLRYPTARETSAALLRVLAQGRPTVMADLEHLDAVPEDAVLRLDVSDEEGETTRAILRLAGRPEERARLGRAGSRFAAREHSEERCLADYEAVVAAAARRPAPGAGRWPAHWIASTDGKMGA